MPVFKEMDADLAWKAIEGHVDIVTPAARDMEARYQRFTCPRCSVPLQKEFDTRHVFADPQQVAPRALLRCPHCRYLIDPHSNVIINYGDASCIPYEALPVIGKS